MKKKTTKKTGTKKSKKKPAAADVSLFADWFANAAVKEREEEESLEKSFEPGEGVEEVLGD